MRSLELAAAVALVLLPACGEQVPPTQLDQATAKSSVAASPAERQIIVLDRCEPASFNAALGEGTCVGDGKVTFEEFIAELQKKQTHSQWRFQPKNLDVKAGRPLAIVNEGGEVHTFTRVAAFGGGIVPELNELSGNPTVAPECTELSAGDFLVPGSRTVIAGGLAAGTAGFQCCIHPWMRTTSRAH